MHIHVLRTAGRMRMSIEQRRDCIGTDSPTGQARGGLDSLPLSARGKPVGVWIRCRVAHGAARGGLDSLPRSARGSLWGSGSAAA